ncbi:MAG: helix-turn-helix domain-containing protein [Firmicutes bacterium]|nr:helix-turn-helix domain-containing protein [Bacillota bacterium]
MGERLLTPEAAAERLAVSPKTVRDWLRAGILGGVKIGRLWRIREEDLGAFVEGARNDDEEELTAKDLAAVRRGLEDIRTGHVVRWEDLRKDLRP